METSVLQTFKENPLFFLAAVLAAGVGLVLGLVALVVRSRAKGAAVSLGAVAVLSGLVAMGLGALGGARLRASYELVASTPGLTASDKVKIQAQAAAEASHVLTVGLGAGALPLLLGVLAVVLALTARPRPVG